MIRLRRLSVQLIVWFAAIALVPLSIVTVLTYLAARSALRDQVTTGLYATARRQANQLATYVREREQNVALSRMPGTIAALEDLRRASAGRIEPGPAFDILDRQYRPFLSYYQEAFGYDDLALVLPDGRVVFSATGSRRRQCARRSSPDYRIRHRIRSCPDFARHRHLRFRAFERRRRSPRTWECRSSARTGSWVWSSFV